MNWEKLTSKDFEVAVKRTGVCVVSFGVLERHGDHLPLGTDYLNGYQLATRAAEIEEAVVFPPFYFGQIYEARCFPGTITLKPDLLLNMIQNVLDEIGRNGFKKIVLVNAHGGNDAFLKFLVQCQLEQKKDYQLYLFSSFSEERKNHYQKVCDTTVHGHACECETSISLYHHPELVKMNQIPKETVFPQRKLQDVPKLFSGLGWYSNYPDHYVGNANVATAEKGKALFEFDAACLATFIADVKKDQVLSALSEEFHSKTSF